jgi:hypothetical protein
LGQSLKICPSGAGMSDEPKKKRRAWLAFWIVIGALFGFAVLSRLLNPPTADAPKNSAYAIGPFAPRDGGESDRIHFGADKAVAIALEEVKKREGWSGNPDWVTAEWSEALTWDVVVRRWSRTSVGRRIVVVSARTGKVLNYEDPND